MENFSEDIDDVDDVEDVDARIEKKVTERLRRYDKEYKIRVKDNRDLQIMEEVFDKTSLLTLNDLMNEKNLSYLNGVINSGKEARVYWGVKNDGTSVAVKIYLVVASEFRKRLIYIEGDPRFKNITKNNRKLIELWTRKEYRNLLTAYNNGINVPKPLAIKRNVIIMEFIGEDGYHAELLVNVKTVIDKDYNTIISYVKKLYRKAHIVHADLSEFNIFKYRNKLIIFDFGSGVHIAHPLAKKFLERDLNNINHFFSRRGINTQPTEKLLLELIDK